MDFKKKKEKSCIFCLTPGKAFLSLYSAFLLAYQLEFIDNFIKWSPQWRVLSSPELDKPQYAAAIWWFSMWFPLDNVTSDVAITSDAWINTSYTTVVHYQFIWHTDENKTFLSPQANLTEVLSLTFSTNCTSQDIIFTINLDIILLKKFSEPLLLLKKIKFHLKSRKEKRCYNNIDEM